MVKESRRPHRQSICKKCKTPQLVNNIDIVIKSQSVNICSNRLLITRTGRNHSLALRHIRRIPYSQNIIDEYNTIAHETMHVFNQVAAYLNAHVHLIFLFAGAAYIEQCFVSKIQESNIVIESIHFVDLHYTDNEKTDIIRGFIDFTPLKNSIHTSDEFSSKLPLTYLCKCHFYDLHLLSSLVIHSNSICIGFRPQIIDNKSHEIDDFITRYHSQNNIPILLIRHGKLITLDFANGEQIQSAIQRLY